MKVVIGLFVITISMYIYLTYDRLYRNFLTKQDGARYLLQQDCSNCIVEANVRYIGLVHPSDVKIIRYYEYHYSYNYQFNNNYYYQDLSVSDVSAKYFSSPNFNYKKVFSENIIVDSNDPSASLPIHYAKMLVAGKDVKKFTFERYISLFSIICCLVVLFYEVLIKKEDKRK